VLDVRGIDPAVAPLDVDPRPIVYALRHGDVRHCVVFGGELIERTEQQLVVVRASARSCPLE
jgi:hypothetical protein